MAVVGHVADAGILGHDQQVAAQRDVAAAGHRRAMHLGNGRFGTAPQAHEVLCVALHEGVVDHRVPRRALLLARVVDLTLTENAQVIATAKTFARAFDHDDVNRGLGVRPLHCRADLPRRLFVDGVQALRPVEQQASHAGVGLVGMDTQSRKIGHVVSCGVG
jgi:hypothetical protein